MSSILSILMCTWKWRHIICIIKDVLLMTGHIYLTRCMCVIITLIHIIVIIHFAWSFIFIHYTAYTVSIMVYWDFYCLPPSTQQVLISWQSDGDDLGISGCHSIAWATVILTLEDSFAGLISARWRNQTKCSNAFHVFFPCCRTCCLSSHWKTALIVV